jgi:Cu+-exporting ATPase
VDTVAFDKTGTLTEGRPAVVALHPRGIEAAEFLRLAASVQAGSEHPLARAVVARAASEGVATVPATMTRAMPGRGVTATVGDRTLHLGSARLMAEQGVDPSPLAPDAERLEAEGRTVAFLSEGRTLLGLLAFGDRARPGAAEAWPR